VNPEQWHNLRKPNVGASEVGAVAGIHEYLTGYGLAARKLGKLDDTVDNAVLQRGRLLEPVARQLLAEQHQDWQQIPAGSYYYDPEIRLGCTPDLFVKTPRGIGVVQIKSVEPSVFARKWRKDATVEPPLWIALQAMVEQHLTNANFAVVAALVVGYGVALEVIEVPYLAPVIETVRGKVKAFWEMVDRGELPPPDYDTDRDNLAQVLRQDDGTEIDLTGDNELPAIVDLLDAAKLAKRTAEDSIDQAQAKILHRIGTATRARFAGGVITAKTVNRNGFTVKPSSYRKLTVRADERAAS